MKTVNIKTILILTFQLAIIIVLVVIGAMYVKKMEAHSENSFNDNIRSVRYCSEMQKALDGLRINNEQLPLRSNFENNLQSEMNNITEIGEKELADKIKEEYFLWLKIPEDPTFNQLMTDINAVNELNINAIEKKNEEAKETAASANKYIIIIGFFGALAAFLFTFTFIGQLIRPKN